MHIRSTDDPSRLLPALYDAAGDDSLWQPALEQAAGWLDATEIHYFVLDKRTGGVRFSATAGRVPEDASDAYFRDWAALDPRSEVAQRAAVGELIACHRHFDADFVRRDPFYNGFLLPLGLRWVVAAKLIDTPDAVAIGGVLRGPEASPYDAAGLARVGAFVESLSHAAALHERFRALKGRLAEVQAMTDTLAAGLFVVKADARVLTMNAAAEAILRRGDALRATNGRLRAVDPGTQPLLAAAVAAAASVAAGRPGHDARGVLLPRTGGAEPYRIAIWPLTPGAAIEADDGGPRVLLSVVDPQQAMRPPVPAFASMYRLTAAEATLVEHLAAGEPLAEIAERRRVRISTLRSQLSTVLAKTGTRRQGDVVRLLSEWPALRQGPAR